MSPESSTRKTVLACRGLTKTYGEAGYTVPVLKGIDLTVQAGEIVAIVGASGSGKSTLLHLLGGLDGVSAGSVEVMGRPMSTMNEIDRGRLRNEALGFVYQFHHLLAEFSAIENVAMPLLIRRTPRAEAERSAEAVLRSVGLGDRLTHRPAELSGGERQRCALARAIVTKPACVLADEPTGNLDRQTAQAVFEVLLELNRSHRTSFVLVTHDPALAARAHRTLTLVDGALR